MIDIKKPTAFRITKEANDAGEEILKEPGNLGTISELAILGITLVIKSEDKIHQSIEWSTISKDSSGIMKGRMKDYENHESLAFLYQLTFKDSDHKLNKQLQIQIILFIALTDRDRSPK